MKHIAYCFDTHYRQHFGASVSSLLLNFAGPGDGLCIHVLTDTVDAVFASQINKLQRQFRATIKVYALSEQLNENLMKLPLSRFYTRATYFNILLADILPKEVDRVLCLDSDTIVLADLQPLLNIDLVNKTLGGVADFSALEMKSRWSVSQYINSGVMLIDLQRWRAFGYTQKCFEFSQKNADQLEFLDQCAINGVLDNDIQLISGIWNCFVMPGLDSASALNAKILHYFTESKPWHSWYEHPLGQHYWRYLNVSPWSDAAPIQPRNAAEAIRLARFLATQGKYREAVKVYEKMNFVLGK